MLGMPAMPLPCPDDRARSWHNRRGSPHSGAADVVLPRPCRFTERHEADEPAAAATWGRSLCGRLPEKRRSPRAPRGAILHAAGLLRGGNLDLATDAPFEGTLELLPVG